MKKGICLFLALMVSVVAVTAAARYMSNEGELVLVEKDPSDWSIIEDGAKGIVRFKTINWRNIIVQQRVKVMVWDLEPRTKYTLIYYGDSEHNDEWPYATCIVTRKTSTQGYFNSGSRKFAFMDMLDDDVEQKFWVVPASDVDCSAGIMTAWNPSEILFEYNTV